MARRFSQSAIEHGNVDDTARGLAAMAAPLASGLLLPWAFFSCWGWIEPWSFGLAVILLFHGYVVAVWRWSTLRRGVARRRTHRRQLSDEARALCALGLAAALLLPCLSLYALCRFVGEPRAVGAVARYDAAALFHAGASIDVTPTLAGISRILLLPGGRAFVSVPREGRQIGFGTTWRSQSGGLCLDTACFRLDSRSGRIDSDTADRVEIGRIHAVAFGVADISIPEIDVTGLPWELLYPLSMVH